MHRIDGEGATSDSKFTEGNPSTGAIATVVTADWANAIQEEVISVLLAAGVEPNKANNAQLLEAIVALIAGGGEAVTAAGVTIVDAGSYISGNNVEAAIQQLAAKLYAGTINANQIRRSVFGLTGDTFQTEPEHAEAFFGLANATAITYTFRPDSALNLPIGTGMEIVQTGAGKVTFVAGAGVTLVKPPSFNARSMEQNATVVAVKAAANLWRLGGMLEAS